MTEIAYIAGLKGAKKGKKVAVGAMEATQRGGMVQPPRYIPYTQMSKGEMALAILAQKARILADYTENPVYKKAVTTIDNALYAGVSGYRAMGAIDDQLLPVVRAINAAKRDTAPATRFGVTGRVAGTGIHIGADPIIPYSENDCEAAATRLANKQYGKSYSTFDWKFSPIILPAKHKQWVAYLNACKTQHAIEEIFNKGLENCGGHLVYGFLPQGNGYTTVVVNKNQNQQVAMGDLAVTGGFDEGLLKGWLEAGVMRMNATQSGIGPKGQAETNAILTTLPEQGRKEWMDLILKSRNLTPAQLSNKLGQIIKKYSSSKVSGIGMDPVTASVLTAIIGAVVKIAEMAKDLRAKKAEALASVSGFGSKAFGPIEGDWDQDGIPNETDPTPNGETNTTSLLPWVIGGAAAWYLLK